MCECKCPLKALLSNPDELKAKLHEKENIVLGLQGILLFRLIPQFIIIFVLINLVFIICGVLDLTFLAVATLLAIIYTLGKVVYGIAGEKIIAFFFPSEFDKGTQDQSNHVRSVDDVADLISGCPCLQKCPLKCEQGGFPIKRLIVLGVLFLIFCITGTFWLNVIVVNLILILPGVLLHPAVYPYTLKAKEAILPAKQKTE